MKMCPKCGGKHFSVIAHVTQEWEVDENESYEKTINECDVVTHTPDDEDLWTCIKCGYNAAGSEFNV